MKFTSEESIRILNQAMSREKEAVEFYESCLNKARHPGTGAVLKILAEEEKKHYNILSTMLKQAELKDSSIHIETPDTGTLKGRLQDIFSHKAIVDFSAENASVVNMLKKAVENEEESFNLYSGAKENTDKPEVTAVYDYLAHEENKHYNMIDNLLSFLEDPGKWLYEEENLIFNL